MRAKCHPSSANHKKRRNSVGNDFTGRGRPINNRPVFRWSGSCTDGPPQGAAVQLLPQPSILDSGKLSFGRRSAWRGPDKRPDHLTNVIGNLDFPYRVTLFSCPLSAIQCQTDAPMRLFLNLLLSEDGATAVEYAVMLSLIILVMLISISASGNSMNTLWLTITGDLDSSW